MCQKQSCGKDKKKKKKLLIFVSWAGGHVFASYQSLQAIFVFCLSKCIFIICYKTLKFQVHVVKQIMYPSLNICTLSALLFNNNFYLFISDPSHHIIYFNDTHCTAERVRFDHGRNATWFLLEVFTSFYLHVEASKVFVDHSLFHLRRPKFANAVCPRGSTYRCNTL